ncbi:MAG: hypothetical protein NC184_03750 [Roseburia sp.]|nr:hypothetical protein [Roseburia sp.]
MKKKILAIISLLVAFVMSFSLFACRKDDGGSDVPDGPLTLDKAIGSVESFLTDSYIGTAKVKLTSKNNTTGTEYSADFEKRGDKVKLAYDSTERIVDVKTGYMYAKQTGGWVGAQMFAAGTVDYYAWLAGALVGDITSTDAAELPSFMTYDDSTGILKVEIDAEKTVNDFLAPLSTVAASDTATLETLVNEYIKVYGTSLGLESTDGVTLSTLIDTLGALITTNKDIKLGALIDAAESADADLDVKSTIKELGASFGINVTDTMYNLIRNRKVGEMVVSVATYIGGLDNIHDISPMDVINAVLFDTADVSGTNVADSVAGLKTMLIGILQSFRAKEVLAMLESIDNPALASLCAVIKNSVEFTALDFTMEIKFDADFNVSKITVDAKAAHDFTGTATDLLLSDNDFACQAELEITEYTDNTAPFDMTFVPAAAISDDELITVVVADNVSSDVKVYFETYGNTVAVSNITAMYFTGSGYSALTNSGITYDADTTSFNVPASLITTTAAKNDFGGAIVMSALTGTDSEVTVYISVAPGDVEEAQSFVVENLMSIIMRFLPL